MRQRWNIPDAGTGVWITLGRASVQGASPIACEPHRAARSVDRWFPDTHGRARAQLREIDRALHPIGRASDEPGAQRERVRRALLDGVLLAWRVEAPRVVAGGVDHRDEAVDPSDHATGVAPTDTWITIELVDEADALLADVRYRLILPDLVVREGTLNAAGSVHLDALTAGECVLTFPDLDTEAWARSGASPAVTRRGDAGIDRTIRQGDTTESLAASRGLFSQTVWDHPRNAALRAKRRNPNVLREGDTLFLPDRVLRDERCSTGRVHRFRRRGVPTDLRLRCLDIEGEPYANEPFHLAGAGVDLRGSLDVDGWMRVKVPPGASRLRLIIGAEGEHEDYELLVGHLDPLDELTGVCDRLRNLGYYVGPSVIEPTADLDDAIRWFRREAGMDESDEVDDALRDALRRGHHA